MQAADVLTAAQERSGSAHGAVTSLRTMKGDSLKTAFEQYQAADAAYAAAVVKAFAELNASTAALNKAQAECVAGSSCALCNQNS